MTPLTRKVKELVRRIPLLYPLWRALRHEWEIALWKKHGKPVPPPHVVKQGTLREFAEKFNLKVFIETGTYYGEMVEAMKPYFNQIYSIELSTELYERAKHRFAGDQRITILHGDSGHVLGELLPRLDQPALFWLDGHYSGGETAKGNKETPIYEELTHIFNSHQKGHVIIIDDARLFGTDPAYPTLDELGEFIQLKSTQPLKFEIENDSIRIFPAL